MHKLDIKPLSVNDTWKGKRFKTQEYKNFEVAVLLILPKLEVPDGPLSVRLHWGFSSRGSDTDNPVKPFIDCLQKKYNFNDNKVFQYTITKEIVKKGKEFIDFEINPFEIT